MSTNDTLRGRELLLYIHGKLTMREMPSEAALVDIAERIDAALAEPVDEPNFPKARNGGALAEPVAGGVRDERAAFEVYALAKGWEPHMLKRRADNPEVYDDWGVQPEWLTWQARAALNGGAVAGLPEPEYWPLGVGAIAHAKAKAAGCDFEDCMHDAVKDMLAELSKAPAKADPVVTVPADFLFSTAQQAPICDCRQGRDPCKCGKGGDV